MKTKFYSKKIKNILLILLLTFSFLSEAQTSYFYYVQLKDKNNTPYSLSNPSEYLSARAIARREEFKIPIDSIDLPVNPSYISQIQNLSVKVHNLSKWMNGVTIMITDTNLLSQVRALPFVSFIEFTGENSGSLLAKAQNSKNDSTSYGITSTQINQLKGKYLHDIGYKGKGIHIAVIDGGFSKVNVNHAFDSLRLQGRLLGVKDVINPSTDFYSTDAHGAMVLSIMAGNIPGQYLGSAPEASYWLIRTEYVPTEYKVETDYWCSGIEFADSVGVDVVNSSLGYYTFYNPTMNFNYSDMNGKVSRASRAAEIASKKGIVVVVSAGNEGNKTWRYIGSPADADGIISVGAVTTTGLKSSFSSYGPSFDGRVKPEVCAVGTSTALVNIDGVPTYGNGTSFASPLMAGMVACLLQLYKANDPNPNIETLLNSVFKSGNSYLNPTDSLGYGIPDFVLAEQYLPIDNTTLNPDTNATDIFTLSYNYKYNSLLIKFANKNNIKNAFIRIYNMSGSVIYNKFVNSDKDINTYNFPAGIYAIRVSNNGKTQTRKILIH